MKIRKSGISFGNVVSILSIASFLIVSQGAMMNASAAEWELWPKGRGKATPAGEPVKKEEAPPAKPETPEEKAAAKAGEEAGKTVAAGATAGTIGKVALIAAGILAIGLAAAGGSTPSHH